MTNEGTKWTNYGDKNFMEYGGFLVKPHWNEDEIKENPSLRHEYDVFALEPMDGDEDRETRQVQACLMCVDLDDTWIDYRTVCEYACRCDSELEAIIANTPMDFVVDVVNFYGWANFQPQSLKSRYPAEAEDFTAYAWEVSKWLYELGAGEFAGPKLTEVQITQEQTFRICRTYHVTEKELEDLKDGVNPFEEEMLEDMSEDVFSDYESSRDYSVDDEFGRNIVPWN